MNIMKKRTTFSILVPALAIIILALTAGANRAAAQNPNCCFYIVDVAGLPAGCFPITVTTTWSTGVTQSFAVATNGLFADAILPPCPPAAGLLTASVAGGPAVPLGATASVTLGSCGVTVTYAVLLDANGCIYIAIR